MENVGFQTSEKSAVYMKNCPSWPMPYFLLCFKSVVAYL